MKEIIGGFSGERRLIDGRVSRERENCYFVGRERDYHSLLIFFFHLNVYLDQ